MSKHLHVARELAGWTDEARARLPALRARLDELVAVVKAAIGDDSSIVDAGRALDEIMGAKLYKIAGHRGLAGLLGEIGISRSTAHNWRVAARGGGAGLAGGRVHAYARARPEHGPKRSKLPLGAKKRARELAAALRAKGLDPIVTPIVRGSELRFRVDLGEDDAARLTSSRPRR